MDIEPAIVRASLKVAEGDVVAASALLDEAEREGADVNAVSMFRGGVAMKRKQWPEALGHFYTAAGRGMIDPALDYNCGRCLFEMGSMDEAETAFRASVKLNAGMAKAWLGLGSAHLFRHHWPEAMVCFERALAIDPNDAELHVAYGNFLAMFQEDAKAEAHLIRALELHPNSVAAKFALGFVVLRQGRWREGWPLFESRHWMRHELAVGQRPWLPWTGHAEEMTGKSVLLRAEQGFGDTLLFSRYVAEVARLASSVTLVVPKPLERLMRALDVQVLVQDRDAEPACDIQTSLMSLPYIFGTTPETTPPPTQFGARPRRIAGKRVGLCRDSGALAGSPAYKAEYERKSVSDAHWRPIEEELGDSAISLRFDDLKHLGVKDFQDTADIIAGLDLVITADTAVCHLAASLGVETWTLSQVASFWGYLQTGPSNPWYPTMRLYRQTILNEWRPVVAQIVADLRSRQMARAA